MKKTALIVLLILTFVLASCGSTAEMAGAGRTEVIGHPVTQSADTTTEAADTTPPEPPKDTLTVVMAGDVLLHEPITESGLAEDGSYNYDHLFDNVRKITEGADLALINEEVILGGTALGLSGYPRFNGPFEVGDAEAAAGFDVILQATNHSLDKGKEGIINDLEFWRTRHPEISVTGIYDSKESRGKICVREVGGVRIAVLNYTYSTNGIDAPSDMPWAVAMLDEREIRDDFAKAEEQADYVIVCPHWGTEYSHEVSAAQRRWAELFVELGADLILGAHPHVIEPVEVLEGADGKKVPVFWSVGNFINSTAGTGSGTAARMVGAMARVTLKIGEDGAVTTEDFEALPLVTQMAFGYGAPTTYLLSDYTPELAAANKIIERDSDFSIDYVKDLCRRILGSAWKEDPAA